jgi:methylated-DNA-[protein]-cysteine S-methyltransferase
MAHPVGMPVIVTAVVAAPWGPIRIATSDAGLVALDQLVTDEAFTERLERRFGVRAQPFDPVESGSPAAARMREALDALGRYLAGEAAALAEVRVDLGDRPAWDQLVLGAVRAIEPGATASYGEVARRIGRPGAARAVGGAVGRNPVGLVIPCHRVIAGDGSLGGYGGGWWGGQQAGLELKRELLAREGVRLRPAPETA